MKIGILTNWPKSKATQRLFDVAKKRGHDAEIIDAKHCYVEVASHNYTTHYEGKKLSDFDAIIPRFTQSATQYGAAIVRQFEMSGVFTTTPSLAIARVSDKLRTLQLLARKNIQTPKTVFAWQLDNIKEFMGVVGGAPLIIKLTEGSQGAGVVLAETEKAAYSVVQSFQALKGNFILQEFIQEASGSDIRAFVVGNRVIASMQRQGIDGEFRSNIHLGGNAEPIKLTDDEKKIATRAAKAVGLAICGVDMLRSNRGPLVLEVNSAPGFEIETITKRDIASKIIQYVEVNARRRINKDRVGA